MELKTSMLQVPLRRLKNIFHSSTKIIQKNIEQVFLSIEAIYQNRASLSKDEFIEKIQNITQQLNTLKRKLEEVNSQEQVLLEKIRCRMQNIKLYTDLEKYDNQSKLYFQDYDLYVVKVNPVIESLRLHRCQEASKWLASNRNKLKKVISTSISAAELELELRIQEFILLSSKPGQPLEAINYAREYLLPFGEKNVDNMNKIKKAMGGFLLMITTEEGDPLREPFVGLSRWNELIASFLKLFYAMYGIYSTESLLEIAIKAGLLALKTPDNAAANYSLKTWPGPIEQYLEVLSKSTTLYVGNLSFYTTEEQIAELFGKVGLLKRIVMGLNKFTHTPCGFCFIEYYTHEVAQDSIYYISGLKLDDRVIRADWDTGFVDGRQYGRGSSGGQIRDEFRISYDPERGDYSQADYSEMMTSTLSLSENMTKSNTKSSSHYDHHGSTITGIPTIYQPSSPSYTSTAMTPFNHNSTVGLGYEQNVPPLSTSSLINQNTMTMNAIPSPYYSSSASLATPIQSLLPAATSQHHHGTKTAHNITSHLITSVGGSMNVPPLQAPSSSLASYPPNEGNNPFSSSRIYDYPTRSRNNGSGYRNSLPGNYPGSRLDNGPGSSGNDPYHLSSPLSGSQTLPPIQQQSTSPLSTSSSIHLTSGSHSGSPNYASNEHYSHNNPKRRLPPYGFDPNHRRGGHYHHTSDRYHGLRGRDEAGLEHEDHEPRNHAWGYDTNTSSHPDIPQVDEFGRDIRIKRFKPITE